MKTDNTMQMLEKVKRVDVSPFLFSRIEQRIHTLNKNRLSMKIVWLSAAALGLLVLLNIHLINNFSGQGKADNLTAYAESMHLSPSDNLYNE